VLHGEKVKSEHIFGSDHDCWDVHTNKDRYWVITSPTNLYSQYYFRSLDYSLSFHVGVMARIMARQRGAPDDAQKARLTPVWRRWEKAAETLDTALQLPDGSSSRLVEGTLPRQPAVLGTLAIWKSADGTASHWK